MESNNSTGYEQPCDTEDIDLTQFDDDFMQIEIEELGPEPIPDGTYMVVIENVELNRGITTGIPMLKWTLRILRRQFRGRLLWRRPTPITPSNIRWIKQDLIACGLFLERLSLLPDNLDMLRGVRIEVVKRTSGEDEHVYFVGPIVTVTLDGDLQPGPGDDLEHASDPDGPKPD